MDAIARKAPSSQEGDRQSGGHRRAKRTPIWRENLESREGRRMVLRNAISHLQRPPGTFHFTLWGPTGNLELAAPNSILCTNPQRCVLVVFAVRSSLRPAAHECIFPALRSATMRHDMFCTRVPEPAPPGPAKKIPWQNKSATFDSLADRTMPATELVGSPNAEP